MVYFPAWLFWFKIWGGLSQSCQLSEQWGPILGRIVLHYRKRLAHTATFTAGHSAEPNVHIFRMWEETRVPSGNPLRYGENVQPLQITDPSWEFYSFLEWNVVVIWISSCIYLFMLIVAIFGFGSCVTLVIVYFYWRRVVIP